MNQRILPPSRLSLRSRVMNLRYRARLAAATATVVVAGLFVLAVGQPASATLLTAGEGDTAPGVAPDTFSAIGTDLVSTGSGSLSDGASYTDYVYKGNSYGASDLNYVFVINAGDKTPMITEAMYSGFAGYDVDAGYAAATTGCSACGNGQLGAPTGVGLSADANTVDFYFNPALNASGNTDDLVIETDSTTYVKTADICLMGTATSCSGGFEPVPAPAPLIGHGLPGILGVAGVLFGAGLMKRGKKRGSCGVPCAS